MANAADAAGGSLAAKPSSPGDPKGGNSLPEAISIGENRTNTWINGAYLLLSLSEGPEALVDSHRVWLKGPGRFSRSSEEPPCRISFWSADRRWYVECAERVHHNGSRSSGEWRWSDRSDWLQFGVDYSEICADDAPRAPPEGRWTSGTMVRWLTNVEAEDVRELAARTAAAAAAAANSGVSARGSLVGSPLPRGSGSPLAESPLFARQGSGTGGSPLSAAALASPFSGGGLFSEQLPVGNAGEHQELSKLRGEVSRLQVEAMAKDGQVEKLEANSAEQKETLSRLRQDMPRLRAEALARDGHVAQLTARISEQNETLTWQRAEISRLQTDTLTKTSQIVQLTGSAADQGKELSLLKVEVARLQAEMLAKDTQLAELTTRTADQGEALSRMRMEMSLLVSEGLAKDSEIIELKKAVAELSQRPG